jgi:hypothetical protein
MVGEFYVAQKYKSRETGTTISNCLTFHVLLYPTTFAIDIYNDFQY